MFDATTPHEKAVQAFRGHGLDAFRVVVPSAVFEKLAPGPFRAFKVTIPEVVFWLMACVALSEESMAAACQIFWSTIRPIVANLPLVPIEEEAFCTARGLLSLEFFKGLFKEILARFDTAYEGRFLWRGFRLHGVDGTVANLPARAKELKEKFPGPKNQRGEASHPQGLIVGLVDLLAGTCRNFELVSLKSGEIASAERLLANLGPSDLFLGDRNFPCFALLAGAAHRGVKVLMRLPKGRFLGSSRKRTYLGPNEWLIQLKMSQKLQATYPGLPKVLTLRIIQYQIKGYRTSYLITSLLDSVEYPWVDLVNLYHERWRQETAHRDWKHTLHVNNLRSETEKGILKELYVHLCLNNIIRWIMAEAAEPGQRPVDLQFKASKRLALNASARMAQANPRNQTIIYKQLLANIRKLQIIVRPGRSYPRRKNEKYGRNKGNGVKVLPSKIGDEEVVVEALVEVPIIEVNRMTGALQTMIF